jgi:hypothetical protein
VGARRAVICVEGRFLVEEVYGLFDSGYEFSGLFDFFLAKQLLSYGKRLLIIRFQVFLLTVEWTQPL